MKHVTVVFDSKYGCTAQMAEYVIKGIEKVENVNASLVHVSEVSKNWKLLSASDAIIFGSPTYFGSVSAEFKKFIENSSAFFSEQKWKDKFAAGFTCSGAASGDKLSTLMQISVFAAQHGMHWINIGLGNAGNAINKEDETNLNRLGCWMGAAGQANENPTEGVLISKSDLATAEHLGERVANTVLRLSLTEK